MARHRVVAVASALAAALILSGVPLAEASAGSQKATGGSQTVRTVRSRSISARAWTPRTYSATRTASAAPDRSSSCPTASVAQAGESTPGVPTNVHAIGGDGSVTVTWCPPVDGQGSITS